MAIDSSILDPRAYLEQGHGNSSNHLAFRNGVMINSSCGYKASVVNVSEWGKT